MYFSPSVFPLVNLSKPKRVYYCALPKMMDSRKYYAIYKETNPNIETILLASQILKEQVIPALPS